MDWMWAVGGREGNREERTEREREGGKNGRRKINFGVYGISNQKDEIEKEYCAKSRFKGKGQSSGWNAFQLS